MGHIGSRIPAKPQRKSNPLQMVSQFTSAHFLSMCDILSCLLSQIYRVFCLFSVWDQWPLFSTEMKKTMIIFNHRKTACNLDSLELFYVRTKTCKSQISYFEMTLIDAMEAHQTQLLNIIIVKLHISHCSSEGFSLRWKEKTKPHRPSLKWISQTHCGWLHPKLNLCWYLWQWD